MAELTQWQQDNSRPGMYHWPVEQNMTEGRLCGLCQHGDKGASPNVKVRCGKAARAMKESGRKGRPRLLPPDTPGCKYWEKRR